LQKAYTDEQKKECILFKDMGAFMKSGQCFFMMPDANFLKRRRIFTAHLIGVLTTENAK